MAKMRRKVFLSKLLMASSSPTSSSSAASFIVAAKDAIGQGKLLVTLNFVRINVQKKVENCLEIFKKLLTSTT